MAGSGSTAIGALVGLNGSDPTNGVGLFLASAAIVGSSSSTASVTVGANSFAVGGIAGLEQRLDISR